MALKKNTHLLGKAAGQANLDLAKSIAKKQLSEGGHRLYLKGYGYVYLPRKRGS